MAHKRCLEYSIASNPNSPKHGEVYHSNTQSLVPTSILVRISAAVKRYQDHGNFYKEKHLIGLGYGFRGLVCYQHGGSMVLEKELRILPLEPQIAKGDCLPHRS